VAEQPLSVKAALCPLELVCYTLRLSDHTDLVRFRTDARFY